MNSHVSKLVIIIQDIILQSYSGLTEFLFYNVDAEHLGKTLGVKIKR